MQSNEEGRNNKRKLKTGTNLFNPNQIGQPEPVAQQLMSHDMYAQMGYAAGAYATGGYAMPAFGYQPYMMVNQPAMYYQAADQGIYSGADQGPAKQEANFKQTSKPGETSQTQISRHQEGKSSQKEHQDSNSFSKSSNPRNSRNQPPPKQGSEAHSRQKGKRQPSPEEENYYRGKEKQRGGGRELPEQKRQNERPGYGHKDDRQEYYDDYEEYDDQDDAPYYPEEYDDDYDDYEDDYSYRDGDDKYKSGGWGSGYRKDAGKGKDGYYNDGYRGETRKGDASKGKHSAYEDKTKKKQDSYENRDRSQDRFHEKYRDSGKDDYQPKYRDDKKKTDNFRDIEDYDDGQYKEKPGDKYKDKKTAPAPKRGSGQVYYQRIDTPNDSVSSYSTGAPVSARSDATYQSYKTASTTHSGRDERQGNRNDQKQNFRGNESARYESNKYAPKADDFKRKDREEKPVKRLEEDQDRKAAQKAAKEKAAQDALLEGYDEYDDEAMEDYEPQYEGKGALSNNYSNKDIVCVMIAEKPSIALSLAKALSGGQFSQRKGRSPICPVYTYKGNLFGHKNVHFKVTSVAGHVYSRDFPKQYSDWKAVDPVVLFDVETVMVEANPKNRIVDHLKHECTGATYLLLWLDNDREGENICFEILQTVAQHMRKEEFKQVYRAVFSSLAPQDLRTALAKVTKGPNRNESESVDARQIIDLKVGVVFSRFQSMHLGNKYSKLNGTMITYGPCQTPTLGFCVQRVLEREKFKPEKYFGVSVCIKVGGGKAYTVPYVEERRMGKSEAEKAKEELEGLKSGVIKSIETSEKKKGRPEGLNTVEMLKHASIHLSMGPQETMHVAERLYLSGFMTYPRTESTHYPDNFDFHSILTRLKEGYPFDSRVQAFAAELQNVKPKKGVDQGDHPPITPTTKIPSSLGYQEQKLYDFVVRNFLGSISPDAVLENTKVVVVHGKHEFTLKGVVMKSPGFLRVVDWMGNDEKELEKFDKKMASNITEVRIDEKLLRESELISLMEKHGIGTDASMATHIQNICDRGYVTVIPGKRSLEPTALGVALVRGYLDIDKQIVEPQLRSRIEKSCSQIAKGEERLDTVVKTMVAIFKEKFLDFKKNIAKMEEHLSKDYKTFEDSKKEHNPWSKCGKCKRYLHLIEEANKIVCHQCDESFALPRKHTFRKTQAEEYCHLDGYQIFYYVFEDKNKTNVYYKICPRCYDSGIDDEEGNANQACISCEVKECQHSSAANYLMDCKSCDMGQIILTNTAKHELVAICNNSKCYQGYRLGENVNTVNVLELDEKLGYHKLKITFTKNNKKRADKPFEGLVFDDEEYKKEVLDLGQFIFGSGSLTAGNNMQKKRSNFSGRGGRGRGRGGRGRGGRH